MSDRECQTRVHFRRWIRVNEGTLNHGVTTLHVFMHCDTIKTSAHLYLEEFQSLHMGVSEDMVNS